MAIPRIIRYGFYTAVVIASLTFATRYALSNQDLSRKVKDTWDKATQKVEEVKTQWQGDVSYERFRTICNRLGPEGVKNYTERYKKEKALEQVVKSYQPPK